MPFRDIDRLQIELEKLTRRLIQVELECKRDRARIQRHKAAQQRLEAAFFSSLVLVVIIAVSSRYDSQTGYHYAVPDGVIASIAAGIGGLKLYESIKTDQKAKAQEDDNEQ